MKLLIIKKLMVLMSLCLVSLFTVNMGSSYAQWLSPGKLTKSHKEIEGLANCTKCHQLGKGILNSLCMSCHEKLIAQIKNNKGFHSRLKDPCISCHTDHKGEDYNITSLDKDKFDHDKTGYVLKAKHKVLCEKCHREEKTYLGLTQECTGCHTDLHKKQLARDCLQCHTFQDWNKTNFDHAKSIYRLTGKHTDVQCQKCHSGSSINSDGKPGDVKAAYTSLQYKPLSHDKCNDCHFDIHKGELKKQTCTECHSTEGWDKKTFEHNNPHLTDFSLEGRHEKVACELCHIEETFKYEQNGKTVERVARRLTSIKHAGCNDCHYDVHTEQFRDQRCDSCHTVENEWKKTVFTHDSKDYKGFKLVGKHIDVECKKCHQQNEIKYTEFHKKKKTTLGTFKPVKSEKCNDCHYDVHKEQFRGQRCDSCHTVENEWEKTVFRHESKEYKGYKLEGKHSDVECKKCHKQDTVRYVEFGQTKESLIGQFKPTEHDTCLVCHEDKHKGQYQEKCSHCHSPVSWDPKNYLHDPLSLELKGAHKTLACIECHMGMKDFKGLDSECITCHQKQDPHLNQFGQFCDDCHRQQAWIPTDFKHTSVGFRLAGGHREADCKDCHINRDYRNTSTDCFECHIEDYQTAPNHLTRQYPQECDKCHNPSSVWENVSYDHTAFTFRGAHNAIRNGCATCHDAPVQMPMGTTDDDCYNCHSSTGVAVTTYEGTLNPSHTLFNFSYTCTDCHTVDSWMGANYTHQNFQQNGLHASLDCTACHASGYPGNYAGAAQNDCYTCHQNDYNGALNHINFNFPQDCTVCHSGNSWSGASYSHQSFQLSGVHTILDCTACHASGYPGEYAGTADDDCYACHSSDYQNESEHAESGYPQDCTTCHSVNSWEGAAFQHVNFKTKGVHTTLNCTACHTTGYPGELAGTTDDECHTCHVSDYEGAPNHALFNYPHDCSACHLDNSWTGASFTHQSLNLNSLHSALDCTACHASGYPGNYAGASQNDCFTCHQSDYNGAPNHTAFSYPQDCTTCHSGNSWQGATFQHQSFQLRGIHATLSCNACHSSGYPGNYAGTSDDECFTCHESDYNREHNNQPHDCTQCHDLWGW
ncbi:MAG: hypothetical protein JSW20_06975 [Nitrospiraceae bacterium]|nr:MAG: hypothetical protein JSW20_06975 [Nitrospiraceae bacterium]